MSAKWDGRFLELAALVASWSKDPSTRTGAVIVRPDRTVVSLGYNGFPRGIEDRPELLADRREKYLRVIHCEENALITAQQSIRGCTLYTWPFPSCTNCAAKMIQAGVARVVAPRGDEELRRRWRVDLTREMFTEAGVQFEEL